VQPGGRIASLSSASHYDTKLFYNVTFVAPTTAAPSSVRCWDRAHHRRAAELWFVFFDGEEAVRDFSEEDGLWGSKFFVEISRQESEWQIKAMCCST